MEADIFIYILLFVIFYLFVGIREIAGFYHQMHYLYGDFSDIDYGEEYEKFTNRFFFMVLFWPIVAFASILFFSIEITKLDLWIEDKMFEKKIREQETREIKRILGRGGAHETADN